MKTKSYNYVMIVITVLVISNLNFAQWTQLTGIPTARTFAASCEVDSKIYVLGGTASTNTNGSGTGIMDVYNPILNSWDTTKANMPTGRVELGVCAVNKKIYAIGGSANHSSSPLGMVEEYDPLTDTWNINKTPMPTPRKGAAFGVIDNKIYVAGGTAVSDFTASGKLEIYDPVTNTWDVTKKPMPQSMYQPQGAVVNDKFYVIGGLLGSAPWTGQKIVQMYDPVTDTWSYRADLKEGRVGHTTNVVDGKIYTIGGDKQPPPVRTVEEYNPNLDSWTVIDSTPSVMVCHTTSVVENKIYVISGSTSPIHPNLNLTNDVFSYQLFRPAQLLTGSFKFGERTRNYEVYLPQNYHPNMPVVFALHGYTETVQWFKDYTRLHELGNTTGFITVYPSAIDKSWNSGLIAPGWPYIDTSIDDVGFISALIDTLEANYNIDMNRIYCCGYSLGGEMTYRLAIELGYRFAAVASVCGLINDVSGNLGNPIRSIPILHIHGTEDNYETWNGDNKNLWTVPKTINFWLQKNNYSLQADTVTLPDLNTTDGCSVEKISYTNYAKDNYFLFYKIIKGGHSWPSSSFTWNGEGNKNKDINANVEIWNFFKNFENPLTDYGKDGWSYQLSGTTYNLNGVYFINANNGVIVGDSGIILKTSNGGEKWEKQISGTDFNLQDVQFTDANNGIIVGGHYKGNGDDKDIVLHTEDGGETWMKLWSDENFYLNKVCFVNDIKGMAVGWNDTFGGKFGHIIGTNDGGKTWHDKIDLSNNPYWEIHFNDVKYITENFVIVVGDSGTILKTTDGGKNWQNQISGTKKCLRGIYFTNPSNGITVGGDYDGNNASGIILRTTDGGDTWMKQSSGDDGIYLEEVRFSDANNGIAVGMSATFGGPYGHILGTKDGGLTWEDLIEHSYLPYWRREFKDVHITDENAILVVGNNGSVFRTSSWIPTEVKEELQENLFVPKNFILLPNYPNPFNPSTKIRYSIPKRSNVVIKVYDILGKEVITLVNEEKPAGTYESTWDAANLPSGVYFYQLKAGKYVETKKMILMK